MVVEAATQSSSRRIGNLPRPAGLWRSAIADPAEKSVDLGRRRQIQGFVVNRSGWHPPRCRPRRFELTDDVRSSRSAARIVAAPQDLGHGGCPILRGGVPAMTAKVWTARRAGWKTTLQVPGRMKLSTQRFPAPVEGGLVVRPVPRVTDIGPAGIRVKCRPGPG